MKAKIEKYERLRKETEDLKDLEKSLNKIFKRTFDYLKKKFLYIREDKDKMDFMLFKFYKYSEYDGFRVENDNIMLHYYDCSYEYYDDVELPLIHISIVENEAELDKWFDSKVKEYEKSKEQHKLEVEQKNHEDELAEYKRLKEIYEGIER